MRWRTWSEENKRKEDRNRGMKRRDREKTKSVVMTEREACENKKNNQVTEPNERTNGRTSERASEQTTKFLSDERQTAG